MVFQPTAKEKRILNTLPLALPAAGVFAATLLLAVLLCRAAPRLGLVAHPNSRSSHTHPTANGGGLAFVVALVVWLLVFADDFPPAPALAVAGIAIAFLGLVDDFKEVRRDVRLACHLGLAAGLALGLFDLGSIALPVFGTLATEALAAAVLVLGLVWWLNLYNFMDGIDGLAASQAIAYALGALLVGDLTQSHAFVWVLLAAALGFLAVNWAPARIFMGDVGSGFLGLTTGGLALWLWQSAELPFVASCILLLAFWLDASYTLGVRIVTGQAFAEPHRSHLYQIVARRLGHGRTTVLFWLHWLLWLLPLAALAVHFPAWQLALLAVACLPIAAACVWLRAGMPDAD